jgi:hypothetical protein
MAELGCIFNYIKKYIMKKVLAIVVMATLAACGGASTEVKTDSTATTTDSTVVATDSTAAVVDTTVTK